MTYLRPFDLLLTIHTVQILSNPFSKSRRFLRPFHNHTPPPPPPPPRVKFSIELVLGSGGGGGVTERITEYSYSIDG